VAAGLRAWLPANSRHHIIDGAVGKSQNDNYRLSHKLFSNGLASAVQ
jgi:hypothetical protein